MDRLDAIDHGADSPVGAVSRKDPIVTPAKEKIGTRTDKIGTRKNPLVILHDHVVPRGKKVIISCPFPLKIGNGWLYFDGCMKVKASRNDELSLRPFYTLDEGFARGWNSLPEELRRFHFLSPIETSSSWH